MIRVLYSSIFIFCMFFLPLHCGLYFLLHHIHSITLITSDFADLILHHSQMQILNAFILRAVRFRKTLIQIIEKMLNICLDHQPG